MKSRQKMKSEIYLKGKDCACERWKAYPSLFQTVLIRRGIWVHLVMCAVIGALVCGGFSHAQESSPTPPARTLLLIADNQEHMVTGAPLKSLSSAADLFVTSVAVRSPLANVGGRLLLRETLRFGREQGAGLVLHLGDAADISCKDELTSVFEALDQEAPDGMWFMAPGNHDGFQSGNFARYQLPASKESRQPTFYARPPEKGFGDQKHMWYYACQSPKSLGSDMPKNLAIELYFERLKHRRDASPPQIISRETITFEAGEEGTPVPCRIETLEIKPKQPAVFERYQAIVRLCESQTVTENQLTVGRYANFITQLIEVGGTRIVLLDTSDYDDPNQRIKGLIPIAAVRGFLTEKQMALVDELFKTNGKAIDRKNVIMAGHHPLTDFEKDDQRWIAARAGRYISAHVHAPTNLRPLRVDGLKVAELNIGSALDFPQQSVLAKIESDAVSVHLAGAGAESGWEGIIKECIAKESEWMIPEKFYKKYRSGLYVTHVLESLQQASAKHDARIANPSVSLQIPSGKNEGDWQRLQQVLETINGLEGNSRAFWACQSYYASSFTRKERGFVERLQARAGLAFESGPLVKNGWVRFPSP